MTAGGREFQVAGPAQLKDRLPISVRLNGTSRNGTADDRSDRVPLRALIVPTEIRRCWRMPYLERQHGFSDAKPRFSDRRSFSMVLSQDCLGQPILRLQSPGGPKMQAGRARLSRWSYQKWAP